MTMVFAGSTISGCNITF